MRLARLAIPLLLTTASLALPTTAPQAQIALVQITVAPPVLPVYEQPPIPAPGYLWTPGYWAYGDAGYYWVPGTWVQPPVVGVLWTPGYWGWSDGVYLFHDGYWGPTIGFYGGVDYGFGYGGVGYDGGYWNNGAFSYNSTVNNFGGTSITNVYSKTVIDNGVRTSFNGGAGGIDRRPTPGELAAEHDHHIEPTHDQRAHVDAARANPDLRASVNGGRPAVAATARPGDFSPKSVVPAHAPGAAGAHPEAPGGAGHPGAPAGAGHPGTPAGAGHPGAPAGAGHPGAPAGAPHPGGAPAGHPGGAPTAPGGHPAGAGPMGGGRPATAPHPAGGPSPMGRPGGAPQAPHPAAAPPHPAAAPQAAHPAGNQNKKPGR